MLATVYQLTWHNIPKDWPWISHILIYPSLVSNLDRCKMVFTCVHQINEALANKSWKNRTQAIPIKKKYIYIWIKNKKSQIIP